MHAFRLSFYTYTDIRIGAARRPRNRPSRDGRDDARPSRDPTYNPRDAGAAYAAAADDERYECTAAREEKRADAGQRSDDAYPTSPVLPKHGHRGGKWWSRAWWSWTGRV